MNAEGARFISMITLAYAQKIWACPSGTVDPSPEDLALTNTVARLGRELGIRLLDHVIVGEQDALSLVDIGLLPEDGEVRDGQ